jgi:transposase
MLQRLEFVREYHTELLTMTELAAQYGISRKTGYKWLAQYEAQGPLGLCDRSRRPHHSPQATDADVVEALIALRRRHPRWGAKKLLAVAARRDGTRAWPSRSTVCTWLKQHGLVAPRRRRVRSPHTPASPLPPMTAANQVWTTDFKGEFRTGDGVYCYPLTLRDGFSRFVLRAMRFSAARPRRHAIASSARFRSMGCPSASAATMAARSRVPVWVACRSSVCGGCAWVLSRSGSRRAIPNKMARMNNFIPS